MPAEKNIIEPAAMLEFIYKNKNSYFIRIKHNASLEKWLEGLAGATIQEKLYVFCYQLPGVPLCQHCNRNRVKLKDRSFFKGFQTFCSRRCSAAAPARISKFVKSCEDKFGGGPRSDLDVQKRYDATWYSNEPQNRKSLIRAKNTRQKTCLKRFGVDHVFKVPAFQEAAQKNAANSMHSYRQFTSKKGNEYRVRGYEDLAIDILEESLGYGEFIADDFSTPRIKYLLRGSDRNYYPDIFVPKENKIIEVKSWYWLKKQPEKNLSIMEHAITHGFNIEFWVFSGNHLTVINNINDLRGHLQ